MIGPTVCYIVVTQLLYICLSYAQPLLIKGILAALDDLNVSKGIIGLLIGTIAMLFFALAVSNASYDRMLHQTKAVIRGCLTSAIYRKMHKLEYSVIQKQTALTLLSMDLEGVETGVDEFNMAWQILSMLLWECLFSLSSQEMPLYLF